MLEMTTEIRTTFLLHRELEIDIYEIVVCSRQTFYEQWNLRRLQHVDIYKSWWCFLEERLQTGNTDEVSLTNLQPLHDVDS